MAYTAPNQGAAEVDETRSQRQPGILFTGWHQAAPNGRPDDQRPNGPLDNWWPEVILVERAWPLQPSPEEEQQFSPGCRVQEAPYVPEA